MVVCLIVRLILKVCLLLCRCMDENMPKVASGIGRLFSLTFCFAGARHERQPMVGPVSFAHTGFWRNESGRNSQLVAVVRSRMIRGSLCGPLSWQCLWEVLSCLSAFGRVLHATSKIESAPRGRLCSWKR